ncbi:SDR family NAD(P)-dependent oxidoreductase [Kitasatospora cystarginea]|uniref:SDR family NAD(P)-dependent oxidoreductase n=1 Tax=Kitasatospora cystarginea TaxID=58350 RepID=UPI0031CEB2DF
MPSWRDEPVRGKATPAGARRLVVLCDVAEQDVTVLRRDLPGVSVARVESRADGPAAAYEHAATRLLGELQRLMDQPAGGPCRVQVVCREATPYGYAGLIGMLRTATQEDPALHGQLIEFTRWPSGEELAEVLQAEFGQEQEHIRYTDGRRQVRVWDAAPQVTDAPVWKAGGVYLITGGAGGIGRLLAADIARHVPAARIVLCGRSAVREPGPWGEYRRVDVTDRAAVAELVGDLVRRYGRLDGIVHAAGVISDDFVIRKSHRDAQRVLAPKAAGLVHLDEATRDLPLDFLAAFSSGAGTLGNAGQADYAAANGFLDAYQTHRAALVAAGEGHGRSVSIAWPLWRDGGMSVPAEDVPALTERFGRPLETDTALRALYGALALGTPHLLVMEGESDVDEEGTQAVRLRARVLPRLKELVAETLRLDAARLDAAAPLDSFGIDSLAVTRLNHRFTQWFGALPKTLLYQYPTLHELAGHLAEQHPHGCHRWLGDTPAGSVAPDRPAAQATARPRPGGAAEPIAIIGLSGRYPDAPTVGAFWDNLRAGRDSVREIPAERWSLDGFFEPDAQRAVQQGASYSKWGAFLDDFARFDAAFFGIAPRDAADMDPQERLFIESAWSALEDAGYTRQRLADRHASRVGVFAGITKTGFDRHRPPATDGVPPAPRTSFGSLANRVSYLLDLRGPSMPIDTMCSASLTAIHEACEHLRHGACELAIAGGVNLYLHPSTYVELCRSRMLATDGRCRSFGDGGDGFAPGEGVGAVLLKPLSKAEADGDPIHAVILGSAINHGGRSNGYTVPNPRAQAALIREALDRAGVSAADIGYIEAHGTGTRLGDPVEIDGLTQAFTPDAVGSGACALGSAKSNIGHLEAAAGIAGLTKAVLQLRHGEFAPTLHAERPNPDIDFAATPFTLRTSAAPWPRPGGGGPRMAGISSFGAGGANAHVIVAEHQGTTAVTTAAPAGPVLLPLSARTPEDLRARAAQLTAWLDTETPVDLAAVAATLQTGREPMDERVCFVASTATAWLEQLRGFLADPEAAGPWHRGRVKATRETLAALASSDELRELVARWITNGDHSELAASWAKGMPLDWTRLHGGDTPARVHLPSYPFAGRRFWFDPVAGESERPAPVTATPRTAAAGAADVERVLLDSLGEALQMPVAEIERRRPFADYGLDSILGVNLVHTLNAAFGTELETTDLFDHGTVERLHTFITSAYGHTLRTQAAAPAPAASPADDAIAVVGMAARYADAEDPRALWDHLMAGHDLVEPVTRWPLGPDVTCRSGSFVRGIDQFDPVFFAISGVEATYMDPQQRIFLEQCWNALEDAGYTGERLRNRNCGVYVGCYTGDYHDQLDADPPAQALWGTMGSVVASRIAYQLDLKGPALTTDTSCSSSLVSLHLACRDLRDGTADMAIAGGVFIQTTPRLYESASRAGMLSAGGRCHSFDADADGFVPGEGAGAVVLKRLADARRDGDHIYGVVRASGINQDGTTNGITAPSAASQEQLLRDVHARGGIEPGGIQLVEAHGTATQLGDPIEFRALTRAFEGAPAGSAVLGSIKTNLGHTQFAAGIAGVIKSLLALEHRQIPPMLHFRAANRAVALEGSPFTVTTAPRPWATPAHGPRRAAVSSFGASGTNAHVVLEEHPAPAVGGPSGEHAFLLSARTPAALHAVVERLLAHLDREPGLPAAAVAYSLAAGRGHFAHRLAVVAADLPALAAHLRAWQSGTVGDAVAQGETAADPRPVGGVRELTPTALARAYVRGEVDRFTESFPPAARRQVPLPTYPFERQRYWIDTPAPQAAPDGPAYRLHLTGQEFFLADHHVGGRAVLPGVLTLEAARRAASGDSFTPVGLRDVVWPAPFPVEENGAELCVDLDGDAFRVLRDGSAVHAQGRVARPGTPTPAPLDALRARCGPRTLSRQQCHDALEGVGIRHGDRLRAVDTLAVGDGEVLARLVLPAGADGAFALHPAMLDSAIQAVVALHGDATGALAEHRGAPALPFALDAADIFAPTTERMWAHLRHTEGYAPSADRDVTKVDIDLYDDEGRLGVSLRGYASRRMTPVTGEAPRAALLAPVWDALPATSSPRLPAPGARVVLLGGTAEEQAELRRHHPDATVLHTHDDEPADRLAARLPAGTEHVFWLAPAGTPGDPAGARPGGALAVFRLIKALLADGADARDLGLTAITRQARLLPGDDHVDPAHAGVHGLLGTLAKEYPHWRVRVADIEAGAPVPWTALLELPADPRGEALAHRHGEWYRQRLLEVSEPGTTDLPCEPGGVIVAIGGAGGIGVVWTEHMMRRHGARVVWIGRRPLDVAIAARQDALAAYGPKPDYVQADATDRDALRRACDEIVRRHGPVRGVLHTAIVLGDQSLARMDEDRFRATYEAKADVAVNLADAFAGQPLDFVAFFSSMQAFFKAPGQANYAAGCTFADAFAEQLSTRLDCPVKVMNWGYWAGVGIVTADGYRRRMAQLGLGSIEPAEGMAAFDALLASPHPQLALLKATDTRSIDGIHGDDALTHLAAATPSLITALREERSDRRAEIERLREKADGHAGAMQDALVNMTWALLQSLGMFRDGRAATADEWRAVGGVGDRYARWMSHSLTVLADAGRLRREGEERYAALDPRTGSLDDAWADWDREHRRWLADEAKRPQAVLVDTTLRSLTDILTGRRPATDVMFPNASLELVEGVYKNNPVADYFNDVLADTLVAYLERRLADDPSARLRILEIGAGTGGTSAAVFRRLRPWARHIEKYSYTDISKAFLLHAQREYSEIAPYLDPQLFNAEKPLAGQPVAPGEYDVVIATNVLHATRNIRNTLRNAKAAARTNALLLLNELSDNILFSHLTFGLLDGWWLYDDPAPRIAGSPGLAPESWRRVLGEVGFRAAFVAAEGADDLGQQVIVAESDGAVRQPRPEGASAFRGTLPEALPRTAPPEPLAPSQRPAPAATGGDHDERLLEPARDYFRRLVADTLRLPLADIRADVPFERYGIDSILVVQLTDAVRKVLDNVGSTLFFEVRTVDGLVRHFLRTQPAALAALVGPADEPVATTDARTPSVTPAPAVTEPVATARPANAAHAERGDGMAIAIVGMAGRYPGAVDLDAFWENLLAGRDSITEIPEGRWDHSRYYDPRRGVEGKTYSKWGGFLDGIDEFDPLFFGISPKAASMMDPQERLFLQCAHATLEDAGYTRDALRAAGRARAAGDAGDIGVFVGAMYSEYQLHGAEYSVRGEPVVVPGSLASIANRVSYYLDASGPSVTVDTMCASALSAIHLACAAIRSGECGVAVAGGVNLSVHPSKYLMIGQGQFASSDGRCRSFGEGGDGYVPGEGVGAVLLRPLEDAVADGDRVLGVIRGSALNHGGHTHGFTVPNPLAQAAVIRGAWRRSGVDPRDIGCIEAHGTGTSLGDPIEIAGLSAAFGEFTDARNFCAIGSVKSNIGHLESAAGVAGLAKLLLQMRHGTLVPSLHAERTNPEIDFTDSPFVLQREAAPWPRPGDRPRLGGVSSFGAGGSNAHLVVEEYVEEHTVPEPSPQGGGPVVVVLSAFDDERLRESAGRLRDALRAGDWTDGDLGDIAYTLQAGREAMTARFAVVVSTLPALADALDACARGDRLPDGAYVSSGGDRAGAVRGFLTDEDLQETAVRWARRGKLAPLAEAWTSGLAVDWALLYAEGPRPRKVGLPSYPFARERYWYTDGLPELPAGSASRTTPPPPTREIRAVLTPTAPAAPAQPVNSYELPEGDLTLHPVWEPARLLRGTPYPSRTARVVAVGLEPEALAALSARYPNLVALHTSASSAEEVRDELAALGAFDHVIMRFPTAPAHTATARIAAQRGAIRRMFRLLKALTALGPEERNLGLTLLTHGAFDPSGSGAGDPAQASLHGMIGGLAKELPRWRIRAVDLADGEPFVAEEVFALPADHRAHPLARRGGQWLRRQLLPVDATPAPAEPVLRRDGVYVLIGGAGDLGVLLSEYLVRQYDAHVVWVGRRAEDDGIRARAAQVATSGRAPVYVSADASDPEALAGMRDEVLRRYGHIDGVVHLAMVFSHTPLAGMSETELEATLSAKVDPCVHFADAFAAQGLDFILLISSLVSFIRNSHQAHYSAACAFEDARAPELRKALDCPVKVVNWGYWGNVPEELMRDVTAMGLAPIDPATAMGALERLLAGPLDQIGFMRLGRPLPIEGALTTETLTVHPYGAATRGSATDVPVPVALAAHHAGPVPGEIDACLHRYLVAELRRTGLDNPRDGLTGWKERNGVDPRFDGWLTTTLRTLTEHGLIDARGWSSHAPAARDAEACRADWAQGQALWAEGNTDLRAPMRLLGQTLPALTDILCGRVPATDVLFPQGSFSLVAGVYRDNRVAGYFNAVLAEHVASFLRARQDADPSARLRVLEIGAGTGGTTGPVLDRLARAGLDLAEYCYTDLSQAFLQHAQDTFGPRFDHLTYRVFDAARPPHTQGLDTGAFDVVIAANVLHATENIRPALRHAKALLRGNGLLALNEISCFYLINHLTFGLLDGWWLYDDAELRVPGSPALSPEGWRLVLEQEGFRCVGHPAADALPLGQQVVVAHSDGLARSPRVRAGAPEASSLPARPSTGAPAPDAAAAPAQAPDAVRRVADLVLAELAAALRLPTDRIDADQAFADYGLDSIVGVKFVQRLNEELGTDLLTTVIFDYRSVGQLAAHIAESHRPKLPAPKTPAASSPAATAPAPHTVSTPRLSEGRELAGREPIAIVGISARFAKSDDADALWQHLAAGDDLVGPVERWDLSGYSRHELSCRSGSFLDGIDRFDARFFNLTGLEATYTDPQQRLFLEQAWTAMEDAGYSGASLNGRKCGVYVGCTGGDYAQWFEDAPPAQAAWGNAPSVVPARIAYHLNLQGPAIAVDTACSSSLVAVHLACQSLWSGETELAIAGGVSVQTTPETYLAATRGGMLSPTGRCHTFDAAADGFVPGEGVGVVVLRRLSDALADGDHIHAVIRGSVVNQDGATNGITAPSALSQERLIRQAHTDFGIDPAGIGMVEAHGTGTQLGDPIECQALTSAFPATLPPGSCALGSIKTNLGHTTSAAGVAGLLKIVLAMRHGQIPPSLHYYETNPAVRLDGSPFYVNTELRPWRPNREGKRVAALSAFGFSGTNGHVVVEDAPARPGRRHPDGAHLFVLSAPQPAALRGRAEDLLAYLSRTPDAALGDVSYTLAVGRDHFTHRAAFVARGRDELAHLLEAWLDGRSATGVSGGFAQERARDRYLDGAAVDFAPLFSGLDVRRTPLPTYPFQRKSYWVATTAPARRGRGTEAPAVLTAPSPVAPAPEPRPAAMDASTLRFLVGDRLLTELSRVLIMEPDEIDPQASFSDFGVDSILSVKLVGAVNTTLGVDLSSTALFEHSSLDRLTDHLVEVYGARLRAGSALCEPSTEADDAPPVARTHVEEAPAALVAPVADDVAPAAPASGPADDGIAVVGIAARFARSPDAAALWAHLAAGDDLVGDVTRWDMEKELGAGAPRQQGSFVDDIERFDAWFFRMSGKEATYTDPQQRIFLEECWHALEDAGYAGERLDGRGCGVYVGGSPSDYQQLIGDDAPPQTLWGNISSVIASRISYFLDLQGPALSVDTACSSSLVAIHQACQDLRQGNTSMALAGGVFIQSTPIFYKSAVRANMLSPTGRCRTFDASADGFVPGEGAGVVVLKRLADALRDGDQVYGVIRGSGMNQDGTTNGLTAPSAGSQKRLLRGVHERAGVDPAGIQLIEAHGTGTPLGDPIEFEALSAAFGAAPKGGCALGSVKTNLGHTQYAAGVAGVIKVLLALKHEQLPPSLHFERSNPAITLENSPFHVNTELRPWPAPANGPRRAGVSSFGAAGTNAHALIEEAPARDGGTHGARPLWLIVLSGQDDATRRAQVERLLGHAVTHEDLDVGDVAYTLATGRRHCTHRWAGVVSDREQLVDALRTWLRDGRAPGVVTGEAADGHRRQDPAVRTRVGHLMAECDRHDCLTELAGFFAQGLDLSFAPLFGDGGFTVVSLPPYPFAGERYWVGTRPSPLPAAPAAPTSPLKGRAVRTESGEPHYAVELTGEEFFLDDHRVRNVPVLPGAAYLELACAAARAEGIAPTGFRLRNVVWSRPARITGPTSVGIALRPREDGDFTYEITTTTGGDLPVPHGQGRVERCETPAPARLDIAELRERCDARTLDHESCYRLFASMGIGYGPALRGIRRLSVGTGLAVARLSLPQAARDGADWTLHPSMLDAAVQATLGLSLTEDTDTVAAALPFVLEEAQILAPSPVSGWAVVRPAADDRGGAVRRIDIELCDDDGVVCVRLLGFSTRVLPAADAPRESVAADGVPDGASLTLMRVGTRPAEASGAPRPLARHEVLLGGLGAIDPRDVQAELGVPCAALPDESDLVLRYTRHAETVLARLRQAIPATGDGQVLIQVVVPADGEGRLLAGLGGLLRTARMEHPKLLTQLVEMETPVDTATLCERLRRDAAGPDDAVVRYADGRRHVPQWTAVEDAPQVRPWKAGGVYLVTGGAGALGGLFAREIARQAPGATLVLCGRSPEGPAQRELLRELDDLGARAAYRALDVSCREAVTDRVNAIVAEHGRLDGVVHVAGVVRDSYLGQKSAEELREVLAAKVAGFVHLDEATAGLDLDFFIGFSSLSAFGNQGQGDYAAANAFMDAYALRRHELVARGERRGRTLVVGWPLWAGGGMAVDAATERRLRDSVGMVPMRARHGIEALERAYGSGAPHVLAIYGERARIDATLLAPAKAARPEPSSAPDRTTVHATVLRRLITHTSAVLGVRADEIDGAVEMGEYGFDPVSLTEFADKLNAEFGLSLTPKLFPEHLTLEEAVNHLLDNHPDRFGTAAPLPAPARADGPAAPADRDTRHKALLKKLIARASVLLDVPAERIGGTAEMSRYGFDSLSFIGFANELNAEFGLSLAPTLFFENPTLAGVADHLLEHHADRVTVAPEAREETPAAATADQRPATTVATAPDDEPIAVIGVSGRFPMADDLDEFWENLAEGRDCTQEVPADRWDWRAHYGDPVKDPNTSNVTSGGFMNGVGDFDPLFFDISPKEAELMDPQQRLLMLYVWKALEDAGYSASAVAGTNTALIAGTTSTGYSTLVTRYSPVIEGYDITGAAPSMGPNRMSYFLDLHGPSEPVDTACSSALVAIHRAIQVLREGQSDMAIAGGVNTMVSVDGHISISKAGMLSPEGRCKSFSDRADGYARGEGVGMLVLKKLSAAERDGDHIHGLIRSSAENHGGRGNSLTAPNPKAQAALLREAYEKAGIDPRTVGYIEAHGTGTRLGDPVEINGLKAAFRELYEMHGATVEEAHCGVGSVKTNIGHLELAAGAAGVIKVLLQMRHRTLVKSLHCERVNPYIDLEGSPFHLVRERQPWVAPRDAQGRELPRRAGVSSFGFGGVNAHVVLEEHVPRTASEPDQAPTERLPFLLSAARPEVLREIATRWVDALRRGTYDDTDLASIAYTSQTGRTQMSERLACLARTVDELSEALEAWLRGEIAGNVFSGRVPRGVDLPDVPAAFGAGEDLTALSRQDWASLLETWVRGAAFEWDRLHTGRRPRRIPLPTYPFRLQRYWVDTTRPANGARPTVLHPLVHVNTSDLDEHRYTSRFTGREFFLTDHRVQDRVMEVVSGWRPGRAFVASDDRPHAVPVLPAVAYLEMARAAAVQAAGGDEGTWSLKLASWLRPLTVEQETDVHVALSTRAGDGLGYEVYSVDEHGERVVFGRGQLRRRSGTPGERLDLAALRARCDGPVLDAEACYERFSGIGMTYGPTLRAIEELHTGTRQAMARLNLPAGAARESGFVLNPSMLDAALQATVGLFVGEPGTARTALPFALRELEVLRAAPATGWVIIRFAEDDHPGAVRRLDLDLCDDNGDVCVRLRGFSARTLGNDAPTEPAPAAEPPAEPDDAYLLHLIEAISQRELSADEFKRSLI